MSSFDAVDSFLNNTFKPDPDVLYAARRSQDFGLPNIAVSYQQSRFLTVLAAIAKPKRILEIGTLGGVSTIALAKSNEFARVDTLEYDAKHAEVATQNIALANLSHRVVVHVGDALKTLQQMRLGVHITGQYSPFDFVFIDADKDRNLEYFLAVLPLCQTGATILVDNVIREGRCITVENKRIFLQAVADHPGVEASVIQTVGEKAWDGFVLARVRH